MWPWGRWAWWKGAAGDLDQLPAELNSFIGRERELGELRRLMQETRALTLCGPGGVGKTRLALRVLASVADGFPDGVWFVELADLRQPDLVVSRVAEVLGVHEEPRRPLADTLASTLRPRRLLLALDNCEHLIEACAALGRRVLTSSPGVRLLVTSREPLRVAGETVWEVTPLPVEPAGTGAYGAGAVRLLPTGPLRAVPGSRSAQTMPRPSLRSAGRSMACRWRSS